MPLAFDSAGYMSLFFCVTPTLHTWLGGHPSNFEAPLYSTLCGLFSPPMIETLTLFILFVAISMRRLPPYMIWAFLGIWCPARMGTDLSGAAPLEHGLVTVHPPLLFFAYGLAVSHLWPSRAAHRPPIFGPATSPRAISELNAAALSIFLGAVWAQHELNWGGWWGWDMVEVGSLIVAISPLRRVHSINGHSHQARVLTPLYIALFYFGVHCHVYPSVHNFVGAPSELGQSVMGLLGLLGLRLYLVNLPKSSLCRLLLCVELSLALLVSYCWVFPCPDVSYWIPAPLYLLYSLLFVPKDAPLAVVGPQLTLWGDFSKIWRYKGAVPHLLFTLSLALLPVLRLESMGFAGHPCSAALFTLGDSHFITSALPGLSTLPPLPASFAGPQAFVWEHYPPYATMQRRLGLEARTVQPIWASLFVSIVARPVIDGGSLVAGLAPLVAMALAYNPQAGQHKLWVR